jgi:transcriptional regulator with XRE-family HTH domain
MSSGPLNWPALIEEALRRRKAEGLSQRSLAALAGVSVPTINAFERGELNLRFERVVAILKALGLFSGPAEPDSLEAFIRIAHKSWEGRTKPLLPENPAPFLKGRVEFAYAIEGDALDKPSSKQLLKILSGLPTPQRFAPFPVSENEAAVTAEGDSVMWPGSVEASWQVAREGQAWRIDRLLEDGPGNLQPGTIFDVTLPILQSAEVLRHATALTRALGGDEQSSIRLAICYTGLEGRKLLSWANPLLSIKAGGVALSSEIKLADTANVDEIEQNLPSVLTRLLAPLYERFGGYQLTRDFVVTQIGENVRREGVSIGPFAVSKDMIARLDDRALRDLLAKLLEAEAATLGVPARAIDVGGKQSAPDGGVDASVRWKKGAKPCGWLPRRTIYFQCKAQPMPPSEITKEMRPSNKTRSIFGELASNEGAYIIFSTDDAGTKATDARIEAMRTALADTEGREHIYLDFLGADRIARWVNGYVGVALWVLEQIDRPLRGWRRLSTWSSVDGEDQPYLIDDVARAAVEGVEEEVRTAITSMRVVLDTPGGCIRLVGISGMGKTRLAEALFDHRVVAGRPLRPALALYADAGHDVATSPALAGEQLVLSGVKAILIIDNCTAKTHRQLAELIRREGSRVSLLTIDYDAGDDQPEGTMVVKLEANSEQLIGDLLRQRCPKLTQTARDRLVEFSGGNARIALAIGRRSVESDDLAQLNDEELLDRLFQTGRGQEDKDTRRAANAAALVGAFYVEDGDGQSPEYPVLAEHAEMSAESFYRHISTLLDWGVVQQRGPQRAVMPPALADRLATVEMRRADPNALVSRFTNASPRLFASFAKRIGRLHAEPKAVRLAERLMVKGTKLGELATLDSGGRDAFSQLAPASPEAALAALERAVEQPTFCRVESSRKDCAEVLAHIAYDDTLFARAMEGMLPLVLAELEDETGQSVLDIFRERFWPALARTMATGVTRLAVIDRMMTSHDERMRALSVKTLDHMLDHWHISSSFMPEWGTRMRSSEWRPAGKHYRPWFEGVYSRLKELAHGGGSEAVQARNVVSHHLREHLQSGIGDIALAGMRAVRPQGYWDEGWRAATDAMHFTQTVIDPPWRPDLAALEKELRPQNIEQCFEAFVLGEPWRHWHPSGREQASARDVAMLAKAVGVRLIRETNDIVTYLNRAVLAEGQNSTMAFGEGLAATSNDLDHIWSISSAAYTEADEKKRDVGLLIGIMKGADRRDQQWVNVKLDAIGADPLLAPYLVYFHSGRTLGTTDVERLLTALEAGNITPQRLGALMMGGATNAIPAIDLVRLLRRMLASSDGILPALETLHMRLFGDRIHGRLFADALIDLARDLLTDPRVYGIDANRADHELSSLASVVLDRDDGGEIAVATCRAMRHASKSKPYWSARDFDELAALLLDRYPRVVLDEIVLREKDESGSDLAEVFFGSAVTNDINGDGPRQQFDSDLFLAWASEDPQRRAERLVELVPYCEPMGENKAFVWTEIARRLIEAAPDPVPVLERLKDRFFSGVSSGSFSLRFVRRKPLVEGLLDHFDRRVRDWAVRALAILDDNIVRWDERDRDDRSRFE